jgi:predicted ribosome quality control (RQC) complex YloA/Tae2 family protein|tara:strand:+ start:1778 stop:2143 length:366 start_codon:yes stop_codon:yes gene_type:complete
MHEFQVNNVVIKIGSNSKENWELVDVLKRSDIWMHLKDAPSAHALIRIPKKSRENNYIMNNSLTYAARMLCAQSSKNISQNTDNVVFIYTNGKYVTKGNKEGEVILSKTPSEISIENPYFK